MSFAFNLQVMIHLQWELFSAEGPELSGRVRYGWLRFSLRFGGNVLCGQGINSALQDRMEVPQKTTIRATSAVCSSNSASEDLSQENKSIN